MLDNSFEKPYNNHDEIMSLNLALLRGAFAPPDLHIKNKEDKTMLNITNISKSYGTNVVLDRVSFTVAVGDRVAIVGLNGAGKSTLLNIIAGNLDANDGIITGADNIAWMPQTIGEVALPHDATVLDFISSARPIAELEQQITDAYMTGDIDGAAALDATLQKYRPYTAESEMQKLLAGFGVPATQLTRPLASLSGGQKSKIAFIRTLYAVADVLLLDEPTNHLDAETRDWVMNYIKSVSIPVVFISHDEEFLNSVANRILFMDTQTHRATFFNTDYKHFLRMRDDIAAALLTQIKNEQRAIKHAADYIAATTIGSSNERKKRAKILTRELADMRANAASATPTTRAIKMEIHPRETERGIPVSVSHLYFGYTPTQHLLRNTSFDIAPGERFLVVGENGMGKSTLLKLLNGNLTPDRGEIKYGIKTTIAYYAQEHENLNQDITPYDTVAEMDAGRAMSDAARRGYLARFNFTGDDVFRAVKTFSPGERSRLSLAKICLSGANLLLLDEPTNHLDIPTKKIIAKTLNDYGGTMIIVSHDAEFLQHLNITRMFILPDCKTRLYDENTVQRIAQK